MTIKDLQRQLVAENIDPNAYGLDGGIKDDAYMLERADNQWSVYFSERGQRAGERYFESEDVACHYILRLVLQDPGTRIRSN